MERDFLFFFFFSFFCIWTFKLQSSFCQLWSFQRLLELGSSCVMSFAAEFWCTEGCRNSPRPSTETQGCDGHSHLVRPCRWVQSLDENRMWAPENCPKDWKHLPGPRASWVRFCLCRPASLPHDVDREDSYPRAIQTSFFKECSDLMGQISLYQRFLRN